MWFRVISGMLAAAAVAGCAHAKPKAHEQNELAELRIKLADSQAREADLQRKVDELSNRLFIVQDQLEAREVASHQKQAPRLPVDARADRPAEEGEVEYAGEARDAHAPRPVLRLVGSGGSSKSSITEVPVES